MKRRILLIDNDSDFLDTWADALEIEGYSVLKATTLEQAERVLAERTVHAAILDVRMRDNSDDKDVSGILFAKRPEYSSLPKIILTKYPGYQLVRDALGSQIDGLPAAVMFLAKQEGLSAMLEAVESVFANHVRINWELSIRWRDLPSFSCLACIMEPGFQDADLSERVQELDSLLRKTFVDYHQVTIGQLLTREAGFAALKLFAHYEDGEYDQFVLSVWLRDPDGTEVEESDLAFPDDDPRLRVVRLPTQETIHFAAVAHKITGTELEQLVTYPSFYYRQSDENSASILDHLYRSTLSAVHGKERKHVDAARLVTFYQEWLGRHGDAARPGELKRRIGSLCKAAVARRLLRAYQSSYELTFAFSDGQKVSYPNPANLFHSAEIEFDQPVLWGRMHGSVGVDNVLVDQQSRAWVVDCTGGGSGPLLHDYVTLEASLRFGLMARSDMEILYLAEKRLLEALDRVDRVELDDLSPEVQSMAQVTSRIRSLAASVVDAESEPYLLALFYVSLGHVSNYDPGFHYTNHDVARFLHSLMLASMLGAKLFHSQDILVDLPAQAAESLWIDESNKAVWVEGRRVGLSPLEYAALCFLYEHKNQLCSRAEIVEGVYGVKYDTSTTAEEQRRIEETRLNSLISRLRQKIEPNPGKPKYIVAVRGEGYRLEVAADTS